MDNKFNSALKDLLSLIDNLVIAVSENNIIFINEKCKNYYGETKSLANEILLLMDNNHNECIHTGFAESKILWRKYHLNDFTFLIGKDITEESKLRKNLDILSYIIKKVPGYIFWKNKDCVLMGCNENFARQVGLSKPEDIVGITDYDLPWSAEQTKRFIEDDKEIIASGKPKIEFEEEQTQKNGLVAHLLTSKVPIRDREDNVSGVLGIYIDITKLKHSEKNLAIEKQKAEAASKAKSEFIANMSHDIRIPITGMAGMIQDLLNTMQQVKPILEQNKQLSSKEWLKLTAHIENDSNILMDSTDQLLQLCNEILEVTRLAGGIVEKQPESFDLYEVVQHNIELLTPVARNKKLTLVADIDHHLPQYLHGLREYLNRSLLNLLSNSLKFTEKGQVTLKVLCAEKPAKKHKTGDAINIQFLIEDTGIGIPEDKFDVIFDHFSRLTPSYEGVYQGSGLGLYTVKRYVEAMNGKIELESKIGCGTCFTLTIPFVVSDKASKPLKSRKSLKGKALPASQKKSYTAFNLDESKPLDSAAIHILVVEDNAVAAMGVTISLKPLHCIVDVAESGEIALDKAMKNTYHLILMDIGLPGISGIEATKKIRELKDSQKSKVPIVALTGHADDPQRVQECLDAGIQQVLAKPASIAELESIFKKYVVPSDKPKKTSQKSKNLSSNVEPDKDKSIFDIDASTAILGEEKAAWGMLDLLCQALPKDINEVKKAQKKGDVEMLRGLFHKLRGGYNFLKTPQLEAATIELHDAVKAQPIAEIDELFNKFYEAAEILLATHKGLKTA